MLKRQSYRKCWKCPPAEYMLIFARLTTFVAPSAWSTPNHTMKKAAWHILYKLPFYGFRLLQMYWRLYCRSEFRLLQMYWRLYCRSEMNVEGIEIWAGIPERFTRNFILRENLTHRFYLILNNIGWVSSFNCIIKCILNRARCFLIESFLELGNFCGSRFLRKIRSRVKRSRIQSLG